MKRLALLAAMWLALAAPVHAIPVQLSYEAAYSGFDIEYRFTLSLVNADLGWTPGDTYNRLVFGDGGGGPSALADFVATAMPAGFHLGLASGAHSGPMLVHDTAGLGWQPRAVGDSLAWAGLSRSNLTNGPLHWALLGLNGAESPWTQSLVAERVALPEPGTLALALFGAVAVLRCGARQRRLAQLVSTAKT